MVALTALLGACSHTAATMDITTSWEAEPASRFFLVGEVNPELQVLPVLIPSMLASIRGGLAELGHTARTGFATREAAIEAARATACDGRCVIGVVRIVGMSTGGHFAARQLFTGAGDMHLEIEAAFFDVEGNPYTVGHLKALPFEDESTTQIVLHVLPTIGPAVAEAISEDDR
jgi:hypothetical protein